MITRRNRFYLLIAEHAFCTKQQTLQLLPGLDYSDARPVPYGQIHSILFMLTFVVAFIIIIFFVVSTKKGGGQLLSLL